MKVSSTLFPDVKLLDPEVSGDSRGFFFESWNARTFASLGINATFVQENHSRSGKGVLRGLHYQVRQTQGKLIRVLMGSVYDVVVDIRRSSPMFGRWAGFFLSAESKTQLWVPPGFAHGFLSLEDGTEFLYKCTDFYAPEAERSLLWNDPQIGITWPLNGAMPLLSGKDAAGKPLREAEVFP